MPARGRMQRRMSPPVSRRGAIVGIDTGGTFTDLVAFVDGEIRTHKVLSTPEDPAIAVLRGLRELLGDVPPRLVTYASTVATNALLQRAGARVLLLTTAGFEDVLEIGRQDRPLLYALEPRPPQPLVPRARRLGVTERMTFEGQVLTALRPATLRRLRQTIERMRPEAVAVCLLHAYANPLHERLLGDALAATGLFCTLSHALSSEYREYERMSTTVVNAYVGPVMSRHLQRLDAALESRSCLRVMQSNGGAIAVDVAGREAVRTVLSGPAAGVIGGFAVARSLRVQQVITFDMGGTSTDVSLIDGQVRQHSEWILDGLPIRIPAIDIRTVGAGGGSIAAIDSGGALTVGPQSAGAAPGPACYGTGTRATVTDANVVLGRLLADRFLGGRMPLRADRARNAIAALARRMQVSTDAAAEGIIRVVNAGMERAIRSISVERGYDPRTYTLVAFGGAAGQHACELAATLGITRVIVPRHPGLLSAWGAVAADAQRDYVRTVRLVGPSTPRLRALFAPMEKTARAELRTEQVARALRVHRSIDMRYVGQSHEINIPFSRHFLAAFHTAHRRLYGYADLLRPVEVVNVRVQAVGRGAPPVRTAFRAEPAGKVQVQRVRWNGHWLSSNVYPRPQLRPGTSIHGPAIVTEFSATTFVPSGWRARVHRTGHLMINHAH